MYHIKKFIKGNQMLHSIAIVIKNRKNREFYDLITVGSNQKNMIRLNSYGNANVGRTILNISINDGGSGFFALYRTILEGFYLADMCGFLPFVNVEYSAYNDEHGNMFDNYFIQPTGFNKSEVRSSMAVAEFDAVHRKWVEDKYSRHNSLLGGYEIDEGLIDELAIISRKYIKVKDNIEEIMNRDMANLSFKGKTIGVHVRGNAFKVGFEDHPRAVLPSDYFEIIDEWLSHGYDKVFLATDELDVIEEFVKRYKDKIVFYSNTARSTDGIDVHNHKDKMQKDGFGLGYDVLRDMHTLASCDSLICGLSQVSIAARIEKKARKQEYENIRIINKGVYGKENQHEVDKYKRITGA